MVHEELGVVLVSGLPKAPLNVRGLLRKFPHTLLRLAARTQTDAACRSPNSSRYAVGSRSAAPIDRPVEARHILHECVETRPARLVAQRTAGERHGHSLARA